MLNFNNLAIPILKLMCKDGKDPWLNSYNANLTVLALPNLHS